METPRRDPQSDLDEFILFYWIFYSPHIIYPKSSYVVVFHTYLTTSKFRFFKVQAGEVCTSPPCTSSPPGCHWGQHQGGEVEPRARQSDRWLLAQPGRTYSLIPGDPDRKWIAGQVTPSGGPSCPHVASQEGRMRSVVLRRRSLALPSSARPEKADYWFQARLSSCSFFYPSFCLFYFPSSVLVSQHPRYPSLTSILSSPLVSTVPQWDVGKHCGHWQPQSPKSRRIAEQVPWFVVFISCISDTDLFICVAVILLAICLH